METLVWSKSEEKWAYILALRGTEVHLLKITGNMFTTKRKVQTAQEALVEGREPTEVGAKVVESFDAQTITKAEIAPGNGNLRLHGGPDGSKSLSFTTAGNNADEIFQTILESTGRTFSPRQEEISLVEALIPPGLIGIVVGLLWFAIYDSAGKIAAGEQVQAHGIRRRGLQSLLIWVAEILGPNATLAAGVVLFLLFVGWAANRIINRPERTVWLPENA